MITTREPRPVTLSGEYVRLVPLTDGHAAELLAATEGEEVWRWTRGRHPADLAGMREWIGDALRDKHPWAVLDGGGAVAGTTSYLDVSVPDGHLEIGATILGRAWWRTRVNTECKLLLLGHAFDDLGMERVAFKTDHRNARSQAALERLGAIREGVLRHHIRRADGTWRDSVYYSILRGEWPGVRDRLRGFLAARRPDGAAQPKRTSASS